ncbi:MAG: hypothetical protein GQ532_12900 [Methylomarinum sp.]|nr:hypothetical protein [Methylomarinum sp.]
MENKTKIMLYFVLFLSIMLALFNKPISQFVYSKYFYSFIFPELEKEILGLNDNINEYLAKIPEIRTNKSIIPKSRVFCTHTLGGAEKSNDTNITLYLWAHCREYGFDGKQLIQGMGAIQPVVIFIKKNNLKVFIGHETVTLKNYSKEISEIFPSHISPHLSGHLSNKIKPNDYLHKKALVYFNISIT